MGRRDDQISRSIVFAVQRDDQAQDNRLRFWKPIRTFFALYGLFLIKIRPELFRNLREKTWNLSDKGYKASFKDKNSLVSQGDMGYSGSTFYTTKDNRYLIKSVPRRFEHSFFRDDLLQPYVSHMESRPKSLLVRITDFLGWRYPSLGGLFGLSPTYHLVMENLLHGQKENSDWQTFDLKPMSYFFPERDIAGGKLASEATKSKLADKFNEKLLLSREDADEFLKTLEQDTELLAQHNAVDYSLMLVRIPKSSSPADESQNPFRDPPNWRTGVPSQDDKWLYRAVILDFFWAKHKTQAKTMTMLVNAWRMLDDKGPMSITTTAPEYRSRFLDMCKEIVKVEE
ncbi:hypothetical protein G647_06579 [Cladophialophora carrionii CBS 160.54]|uniref:PIPK domain-containing protein n=1 Tax=Cladophialophora carrionii CBS 160.54 TaxID=1279043 RepID=V9D6G6_9EURO|nr:uncharacterized protein G647_06579 [Cladophialophora carrionii CBS 160.54]ETI22504.1 hypothetical protein G647_06579 [Cladophialophora carrionii CBS 160.54]